MSSHVVRTTLLVACATGLALACPPAGCPDEGGNAVEYMQGNGHGGSADIDFCVDSLGSNQYNVWVTGIKQANVSLSGTILCNNNVEIVNLYIDIDRPGTDLSPNASITVTQDPDDPTTYFNGVRSIEECGSAETRISVTRALRLGHPTIATDFVSDRFGTLESLYEPTQDPDSGFCYANIEATAGTIAAIGNPVIDLIEVGRDLLGDVIALDGQIDQIVVAGNIGDAGSNTEPVIEAGDIDDIEAESIHADITAGDPNNVGRIRRIETTVGDLSGEIELRVFRDAGPQEMDIAGDVDADVTIHQDCRVPVDIDGDLNGAMSIGVDTEQPITVDGDVNANFSVGNDVLDTITIGGELASGVDLAIDNTMTGDLVFQSADGLKGQVILDANNDTGVSDWGGDVIVDQTTLAPVPHYTQVSSELGGGAVGLAPFNFHQRESLPPAGESRDCDPFHTETITLGPSDDLDSARIRHYGPVYVEGTGPHYRVEFLAAMGGTGWVDRTSLFEVDTALTGTSDGTATTDVVIKPTSSNTTGFKAAGRWRFRPLAGKAKCGSVDGNPEVEYDSSVVSGDLGSGTGTQYDWYQFRVLIYSPPLEGLVFQGEQVNPEDLTAWVDEPFEANADGQTDLNDFADMIDSYNP